MNAKKILASILALCFILASLSACGNQNKTNIETETTTDSPIDTAPVEIEDEGVNFWIENNAGFDNVNIGTIDLGSTDAAAFTQEGVSAASFTAMDPTPARYYHTRLDTEEILDEEALDIGFRIILETVLLFDKNGI